jgi:hypothetical protein
MIMLYKAKQSDDFFIVTEGEANKGRRKVC